jgi:DNA-binding MarR family transcriptional regulator
MLATSKFLEDAVTDDGTYEMIVRELGLFLRRALRRNDRRNDPHGYALDRATYHVLGRLVVDGPGRLSEIAADMAVDLSVVSRQVAALEAAGLVTRTPDVADRRASLIAATDAGSALFQRKREQFVALLHKLLADWTPTERAEFARLMGRFNGAMAAHEEGK